MMYRRRLAVALFAGAVVAVVFAGPVNPPAGPVGPTYKTLAEVEPRTAINAVNTPGDVNTLYKITQPGSYYLTGDIAGVAGKNGITVLATDVTIDLCGFSLIGVPGSVNGVIAGEGERLEIRNGGVRAWGATGLALSSCNGVQLDRVSSVGNGGVGIIVGLRAHISGCIARANGASGVAVSANSEILACLASSNGHPGGGNGFDVAHGCSLLQCSADNNMGAGILGTACTIIQCTAFANENGISIGEGSAVESCNCRANAADGVIATQRCTIRNCTVTGGGGDGIEVGDDCTVTGNTCINCGTYVGGSGIRVIGAANHIEDNRVNFNRFGIYVGAGQNNIIVRNTARANGGGNYSIIAGNELAPIVTNPGSGATPFSTATAWSNFSY